MIYFIIAFLIVLADQASKYLITLQYSAGGHLDIIPNVLRISYVTNSGGAFSMFSDHTMVLAIVSAVVCLAIIVLMIVLRKAPLAKLSLGFILGGAIGNLIDRFVMGYVVDMFETLFIDFAIFNVADIFITIGAVLFVIAVIFFWPKKEKKTEDETSKRKGPAPITYDKPKNSKDRRAQRRAKMYGPDIDETTIVIPTDEVNEALKSVSEDAGTDFANFDDTLVVKKPQPEEAPVIKEEPEEERQAVAEELQLPDLTVPSSEEMHEFTLEEIMKEYGHDF